MDQKQRVFNFLDENKDITNLAEKVGAKGYLRSAMTSHLCHLLKTEEREQIQKYINLWIEKENKNG